MAEGNPSPAAVQAATELMEHLQRLAAAEARTLIEKQDLDPERYGTVLEEMLADTSDRAAAITVYALFDDVLLEVFTKYFNPDIQGGLDSILNPSAFLGASSNRLKLAAALSWVGKELYQDVNILRNIRNQFAHHVDVKSFEDTRISGYISSLRATPIAKSAIDVTQQPKRLQYFFRSIGAFQRFVLEIAMLPYAMKFRVNPRFIYEEWPKNLYYMLGRTEAIANALIDRFQIRG